MIQIHIERSKRIQVLSFIMFGIFVAVPFFITLVFANTTTTVTATAITTTDTVNTTFVELVSRRTHLILVYHFLLYNSYCGVASISYFLKKIIVLYAASLFVQ